MSALASPKSSAKKTPGKVALITGITGQDGSYLAELLLGKGYEVRQDNLYPFMLWLGHGILGSVVRR